MHESWHPGRFERPPRKRRREVAPPRSSRALVVGASGRGRPTRARRGARRDVAMLRVHGIRGEKSVVRRVPPRAFARDPAGGRTGPDRWGAHLAGPRLSPSARPPSRPPSRISRARPRRRLALLRPSSSRALTVSPPSPPPRPPSRRPRAGAHQLRPRVPPLVHPQVVPAEEARLAAARAVPQV